MTVKNQIFRPTHPSYRRLQSSAEDVAQISGLIEAVSAGDREFRHSGRCPWIQQQDEPTHLLYGKILRGDVVGSSNLSSSTLDYGTHINGGGYFHFGDFTSDKLDPLEIRRLHCRQVSDRVRQVK